MKSYHRRCIGISWSSPLLLVAVALLVLLLDNTIPGENCGGVCGSFWVKVEASVGANTNTNTNNAKTHNNIFTRRAATATATATAVGTSRGLQDQQQILKRQERKHNHRKGGWWKAVSKKVNVEDDSNDENETEIIQNEMEMEIKNNHGSIITAAMKSLFYAALTKRNQQSLLSEFPRGGNRNKNKNKNNNESSSSTSSRSVQDPGSRTMNDILEEWATKHPFVDSFVNRPQHQSQHSGLSETEAQALRAVYGTNSIEEPPPPSWFALVAEQFEDKLVRILVGVAVLSALLEFGAGNNGTNGNSNSIGSSIIGHVSEISIWHRFAEPLVISVLLVINASVGVWQSKSAGNSIEALKAMQPSVCTVLRRKETDVADEDDIHSTSTSTAAAAAAQEIADFPAEDLVPGDLIVLKTGDKVPADCRLVKYYMGRRSLSVDETCLTGESLAVEKLLGQEGLASPGAPVQAQKGMVFAGTTVVSGGAIAMVVATSKNTEFGAIQSGVLAAKKDAHDQKTPLAKQLDEFGNQLTGLIGGVCVLVWLASVPKMMAKDSTVFSSPLEGMVYYAKVAVALGVAAIPEGLPAVITLCLSLGTRRMAQRNVIVRNLPSVETLGCVSVICSDKTGTLTTNEMTVTSLVLLEKPSTKKEQHIVEHTVEGVSYSPLGGIEGLQDTKIDRSSLLLDVMAVAALCNDAKIIGHDEEENDNSSGTTIIRNFERNGEPTEAALCVLAEKLGSLVVMDTTNSGTNEDRVENSKKNSEIASYYVDRLREQRPRMATLEFHRERKSESKFLFIVE